MTTRRVALLVMVPAVIAVLCLAFVELWRQLRPRSYYFNTPYVATLGEAIEDDDVMQAYEFLRAGADPNAPIEVQDVVLTGGQPVVVSPVAWAVATESDAALLMLLGFGGKALPHGNRHVACLAEAMGNPRLADLVRTYGHVPNQTCPEGDPVTGPPLLWFVR